MDNNNELYRIVEDDTKKMGFFERLIGIFISPVKVMQNIRDFHVYWQPLLILFLLSIPLSYLATKISPIQMAENSLISLERYGVDYFNAATQISSQFQIVTFVIAIITMIVTFTITALIASVLMVLVTKIFKGTAKFAQYYSMYLHVYIITSLCSIVLYLINIQLGSTLNIMSLAALFMPTGNITMPVFNILSAVSLITIWETIILIIGVRELNGFSTAKAVTVEIIVLVISLAAGVAMASSTFLWLDMTLKLGGQ